MHSFNILHKNTFICRKTTIPFKINYPVHNVRMYWPNFWLPTVRKQQSIFEKTHIEVYSSHLHASFGTFSVESGQLFEAQWIFEHSQEFEIGNIFLGKRRFVHVKTFFKGKILRPFVLNISLHYRTRANRPTSWIDRPLKMNH